MDTNSEAKKFKKEFPVSAFKDINLAKGEFETCMILTKHTVSMEEFFNIHYKGDMKRPCYVNMAEHVGVQFGNDYIFKLSGCAICPLKTPIEELMEYYPEGSYAWCSIYNIRAEDNLGQSDFNVLPENKEKLQKILEGYLELQKLILKYKTENDSGERLSLQDFLDEVIERIKNDQTKQLRRSKARKD